jgi:thiol:disulfide interchange protein
MNRLLVLVAIFSFACEKPAEPAPKAKKKRVALQDGRDDYQERAIPQAELDALVAKAKAENKRVMLMFGGDWCVWCHALHKLFDENAEVGAALNKSFELVKVDIETNDALDAQLGKPSKNGFPVLVILDESGKAAHTQETGSLETGKKGEVAHDPAKVLAYLAAQAPASP